MKTHLCKLLQSKLQCNILQQAVVILFCKDFICELASSFSNVFSKVLLKYCFLGLLGGFEVFVTVSVVY